MAIWSGSNLSLNCKTLKRRYSNFSVLCLASISGYLVEKHEPIMTQNDEIDDKWKIKYDLDDSRLN